MEIKSSTAGRKEDVRDKVSRLTLKAHTEQERYFLAWLVDVLKDGALMDVVQRAALFVQSDTPAE
jgi:hypothetical protein